MKTPAGTPKCLAFCVLLSLSALCAKEKTVMLRDLPPEVQKAVQTETSGEEIKKIISERQRGKTVYEVEATLQGKTHDFIVDAAGGVVESEREVALDSLPPAAKAAIEARAAGAKILRVEMRTTGQTVTYEAEIQKGRRVKEVSVSAAGVVQP